MPEAGPTAEEMGIAPGIETATKPQSPEPEAPINEEPSATENTDSDTQELTTPDVQEEATEPVDTPQVIASDPPTQENDSSSAQDTESTVDRDKPVDTKRLESETEALAQNIILRRIAALRGGKSEDEIAQMSAQDGGFRKLMTLHYFRTMGEVELRSQGKNGEMITGIDLSRGDPLITTHNGSEYQITHISRGEGDNLICVLEDGDTQVTDVSIPRTDVIKKQFQAEYQSIRTQFSEDERTVLDQYVASLEGKAIDETTAKQATEIIHKGAEITQIPKTEDVLSFITQNAENLTDEQLHALSSLQGNIMDQENFIVLTTVLGTDQDTLSRQVTSLQQQIDTLTETIQSNPENAEARNQLEELKSQLYLTQDALSGYQNGALDEFFTGIEEGTADMDQVKKFNDVLKSGDWNQVQEFLTHHLQEKTTDSAEERARKEQRRKDLTKLAKETGLGVGMTLLLMMAAVGYVAKEMK